MAQVPAIISRTPFNGGTITTPLVIAPTDPNSVPLSIQASYNAQNVDFFNIVNTDNAVRMLDFDLQAQLNVNNHTNEAQGITLTGVGGVTAVGTTNLSSSTFATSKPAGVPNIGFFGHSQAAQPAHPVTLADVIAALTALGITA